MAGKRIYIADDEENIRELIRAFLEKEGFEAVAFGSGGALLEAFDREPADLVVLDVMMPGLDGFALCAQLRARSAVPIVIVSAKDSEADRITGITIGGDEYLTKPFSPVELAARVRALFRRLELDRGDGARGDGSSADRNFGDVTISGRLRKAFRDGADLGLSPTELAVLDYLARNADRAVSRSELLKNVWRFEGDVDTRATDDVIKRVRRKLSAAGSAVRIETVWGYGFQAVAGEAR
jgi:DNA-binding response OmpR family regulator